MDSSRISREQLRRLSETVGRHLRFLNRLQRRMDELRFAPDDALYRSAADARDAVAGLFITAHYCACESGVGRAAPPSPTVPQGNAVPPTPAPPLGS